MRMKTPRKAFFICQSKMFCVFCRLHLLRLILQVWFLNQNFQTLITAIEDLAKMETLLESSKLDFYMDMEHFKDIWGYEMELNEKQFSKELIFDRNKISNIETGDFIFLRPLLTGTTMEDSVSSKKQISFDEAIYLTGKATINWWRDNGQPKCSGEVATHVAIAMWESDIPEKNSKFQPNFDVNKYIKNSILNNKKEQKIDSEANQGSTSSIQRHSIPGDNFPRNDDDSRGKLMFIQALPENGVSIVDAQTFFYLSSLSTDTIYYISSLMNEIEGEKKILAAQYAYSQIGKPYAFDFEAPPIAFYCSSLVDWAYFKALSAKDEKPLTEYEGTLYPSNFTLLFVPQDYWQSYYNAQGKDLPVNVTGSNPTLLLHSFNISITSSFVLK